MLRSPSSRVTVLALGAGAAWLPFAGRLLSPDEGGLLLVAGQWSPGSSLYGDYFIDRPPLLIAIVAIADGAWSLRAVGIAAVVAAVLLAGAVGRCAAPGPLAPVLPAATATILVATPLFGGTVVNGELLGLPFLLAGCAAAIAAVTSTGGRATWWALLAGAAGACGALVKQSLVDVFVLAAVLLLLQRRSDPGRLRPAVGIAAGALATVVVVTWAAYLRGTDSLDLWDAVVVFRGQAAEVIVESATGSTAGRLAGLLLALLATGAPLLAVALARRVRDRTSVAPDLRWPAVAVLAFELAVVLLGGSYWLHYLMGLVPGLVLLTAAAVQRPPRADRVLAAAYAVAALSTLIALGTALVDPYERREAEAIAWLEDHARPGDTGVVAFGGANILEETGLRSPYSQLWSLPARVHDPDLAELSAVLAGPDRPTWLVVGGTSLRTWGVDATTADELMHAHYEPVTTAGDFTIYRENDRP